MRLKIFDTRALQHPKPLEIMSKALKIARCGEIILLMIHRREPLPLYEILKAQGLEFRACESDFCGEFEINLIDENLQENLQNSAKNSQDLDENLFLNSALKSPQNKDFSIEFALFNENDESDNSINFTRNFYLKNPNFVANSMKNLSENLVKKMSENSQNSSQNSHEKTFFIFIAQKHILSNFDTQDFIKKFTQISSDFNAENFVQNSAQISKENFTNSAQNSTLNSKNSANSNKKFTKERRG